MFCVDQTVGSFRACEVSLSGLEVRLGIKTIGRSLLDKPTLNAPVGIVE
jgi:hypothetical protein